MDRTSWMCSGALGSKAGAFVLLCAVGGPCADARAQFGIYFGELDTTFGIAGFRDLAGNPIDPPEGFVSSATVIYNQGFEAKGGSYQGTPETETDSVGGNALMFGKGLFAASGGGMGMELKTFNGGAFAFFVDVALSYEWVLEASGSGASAGFQIQLFGVSGEQVDFSEQVFGGASVGSNLVAYSYLINPEEVHGLGLGMGMGGSVPTPGTAAVAVPAMLAFLRRRR